MKSLFTFIFLIISVLFVFSCGEEESTTSFQSNSNVPLKITVKTSEEDVSQNQDLTTAQGVEECIDFVNTLSVVVQGNFPTISEQFSINERAIVVVPPELVTIIASLLNDGQACCSGQTTLTINPDVTNEVTIECELVDEVCNDGQDNNGNEQTDCEEVDCSGSLCDGTNINICIDGNCVESAPPTPASEVDLCTDGIDNDEDEGLENGGTDCDDFDCVFDLACEEICDNGIDDPDADGEDLADCLDETCDGELCNPDDDTFICFEGECVVPIGVETDCDNGVDDDEDEGLENGGTDCGDPDCEGLICFNGDAGSACVSGVCDEVACDDNVNNDGLDDGTDCSDEDCFGETCINGEDGAICTNLGQDITTQCRETICFDFDDSGEIPEPIDNDLDESANCDDFDCFNTNEPCGTGANGAGAECVLEEGGRCVETACDNTEDDDRDGLVDCADPDCEQVNPPCEFPDGPIEQTCDDNFDNDGDGLIDCSDPDCDFFGEGGFCEEGGGTGAACSFIDQGQCDEINCNDGIDNDGNEGIDCADPDCASAQNCGQNQTLETCFDGVDNDGDGDTQNDGIDCNDTDCDGFLCSTNPESICVSGTCTPFEFTCFDGIDNDGNEGMDCADPDCHNRFCGKSLYSVCNPQTNICETFEQLSFVGSPQNIFIFECDDGLDNDGDQAVDCADTDCGLSVVCRRDIESVCDANGVSNCVPREFTCDDGLDNDGDGDIDCQDSPDCAINSAVCSANFEILCYDGIDNDGNEGIDCADPDCNNQVCSVNPFESRCDGSSCLQSEFTCFDGMDNDGDQLIDCMDPDCRNRSCGFMPDGRCGFSPTANCPLSERNKCFDGLDNDEDQLVDCDDNDCFQDVCSVVPTGTCELDGNSFSCIIRELECDDGLDNDNDGSIDCFDSDCDGQSCSSNPPANCDLSTNSCVIQ